MPFHVRSIGKDRMALFSFIQSLNTTFGTSIFEPVAVELARDRFVEVEAQYRIGERISEGAQLEIQSIMNSLSEYGNPDKVNETERIRAVCVTLPMNRIRTVKADLRIEDPNGRVFLFDLKTAKPNISNFKDFKRTLLEWLAIELATDPDREIHTLIAIPYNPYYPREYQRWTLRGMLDLEKEMKVGEEFWDFLGGRGAFEGLLDCFERAGLELRAEFDDYFARFKAGPVGH